MICKVCGEKLHPKRVKLGYALCLKHGDEVAHQKKFTVAIPYSKGAYQLIHDPKDLFTTNPKRTT